MRKAVTNRVPLNLIFLLFSVPCWSSFHSFPLIRIITGLYLAICHAENLKLLLLAGNPASIVTASQLYVSESMLRHGGVWAGNVGNKPAMCQPTHLLTANCSKILFMLLCHNTLPYLGLLVVYI
jgi:hypothetical protein